MLSESYFKFINSKPTAEALLNRTYQQVYAEGKKTKHWVLNLICMAMRTSLTSPMARTSYSFCLFQIYPAASEEAERAVEPS